MDRDMPTLYYLLDEKAYYQLLILLYLVDS